MKQSFDVKGGPHIGATNLPLLRGEMSRQNLDGFYVPHDDEYQNEYLPEANERLAWCTGFTGSFGSALIFQDQAILFVDGRYTLQGADQTDPDLFSCVATPDPGPFGWLAQQQMQGQRIGFDPKLVSPNDASRLKLAANKAGAAIVEVTDSPLDKVWVDRPAQPNAKIHPHPIHLAGESSTAKISKLTAQMRDERVDALIVTSPASLAWLFNIRGGDVACSPLPLGRAILSADGSADLFINLDKKTDSLAEHLGPDIKLKPELALDAALDALSGKTVSLDPGQASSWFFSKLDQCGASIKRQDDPVALPRACKNAAELSGTVTAHKRDAIALCRFLHWLATTGQSGKITEIDAAMQLETYRDQLPGLKDLSFETISGAGPNGALPHYRVSSASNLPLATGSLYLVDSGGQYLDGTTDVTRTVAIGTPSDEMKRHYTLVLKGHIALDAVRFPAGTTGTQLDILARFALWQAGLDYDHGTGHGVGVYLGVHEGPHRIAKAPNNIALEAGMIVSNEPGFYKEGAYGIRIENLQYVTPAEEIEGGDRPMLGFECLTFAPLCRELIVTDLLSQAERDWVDDYHQRVLAEVGPNLDEAACEAWLVAACAPL